MRDNQPSDETPLPAFSRDAFELTEEKFDGMMKSAWESMAGVMKGDTSLSPVVFVFYKEIEEEMQIGDTKLAVLVIANDFNDSDTKRATLRQIGEMCYGKQWFPIAAFLGSEAWMGHDINLRPSEDPNRVEIITLAGISMDGDYTKGRMAKLVRAEDQTISMGEDFAPPEGAVAEAPLLKQLFVGFGQKAAGAIKNKPHLLALAEELKRRKR